MFEVGNAHVNQIVLFDTVLWEMAKEVVQEVVMKLPYDTAKYENKGIFVVKRSVSHDMDQVFPGYQYSPGNWDRQIHC